jgi:ATP-dependent exoDNAse (exonuclease V) beta subunit
MCEAIKEAAVIKESKAEVVLSTIHKAKGLEWDNVILMPDVFFYVNKAYGAYRNAQNSYSHPSDRDKVKKFQALFEEECNIYYVGATRAKKNLMDLNKGKELVMKREAPSTLSFDVEYFKKRKFEETPFRGLHKTVSV